jgi:hypothetical protein
MQFSKENQVITASKKGRRRIGSSVFMGNKFLGLSYLCYLNNRHWYV